MIPATAILFFSRTAPAEARAKAFGPRGERVAAALIRRTERTLVRSGLPVYRSDEGGQGGDGSFGEKLSTAVSEVFALGHAHVIVVSNDCPRLSTVAIQRAARMLEAGRDVVGPDNRGGAWLIGLRADGFAPTAFAALPWQSAQLAEALRGYLPDYTCLHRESDYNTVRELYCDWRYLAPYLACLSFLFTSPISPARRFVFAPSSTAPYAPELRGPPRAS